MAFQDDVEATCQWYRKSKIARINRGSAYEPSFFGHLMDDKLGIGTRIAFDAVVAPAIASGFTYNRDSLKIPFLLDRVQYHGGLAFVLFKKGPKVYLVSDVRTLALGRSVEVESCPTVEHAPTIQGGKAIVVYEFISAALEHCQIVTP